MVKDTGNLASKSLSIQWNNACKKARAGMLLKQIYFLKLKNRSKSQSVAQVELNQIISAEHTENNSNSFKLTVPL